MSLPDTTLLRQLNRLHFRVRTARGSRPGETLIPRSTQAWGIEFESYKDYSPGDDFRYVDWNAVGRLDQLVVRTFTAEREINFHLFLDTSASMNAPVIDHKFSFACGLASALGYIVLNNNDPLQIVALTTTNAKKPEQRPFRVAPLLRHRSQFSRLLTFLETVQPGGKTYLREAVRAYSEQTREPGVSLVISDFLVDPAQYQEALLLLKARGYEVKALQVLGSAELSPERLFRRGKLYDVEDHSERWVTLSSAHLRQYQEALHTHTAELRHFCHSHQILYVQISTATALSRVLTEELLAVGLLGIR